MTGHHHDKRSRGANPLRTAHPDLDQHAAALAQARTDNDPMVKDLAQVEPSFIAELLRRLDDVDPTTIGAVLLIAGNLAGQVLDHLPEAHRPQAGPILANLLQLAGQQLYTAKAPSRTACPYQLHNGKPCLHEATAENDDQLAAVMRGHVALHHPDHTWPPNGEPEQEVESTPTATPGIHTHPHIPRGVQIHDTATDVTYVNAEDAKHRELLDAAHEIVERSNELPETGIGEGH